MTASSSVAHLVIDALRRSDIDQLFCLPGVQNDEFFNALFDARDIRPIHTRHEQGAAYMAMGAAQVTGRPAAFCVVPGPGMLNAGAALTSAYWSYARVFAIIGEIASNLRGRNVGTLHDLPDQNAILRQLTKHAAIVTDPADAPATVQRVVDELHSGVPRPVSLEVPVDVWGQPADGEIGSPRVSIPVADPAEIDRAAAVLARSTAPLFVLGSGATDAGESIAQLAELTQAAMTTRRQGHGAVPTAHPQFVPITCAHRLWADADVVVGIGTRMEWPLGTWGVDDELTVIQINVDSDELDRHDLAVRGVDVIGLHGDAGEVCRDLIDAIGPLDRPARLDEFAAQRAWFDEATAHLEPQRSYTAAIRAVLPDDGVIVEDVTQIGFASHLWYDHRRPRTFLTSGAAGTLGAGTAVAIGASAATDRPVVGIVGDGGFLFTATELATAAQHRIPCTIVVFNDGAFGNVRRIQAQRFGADRTIASKLDNPDFAKLADAFGVSYSHADSPESLVPALGTAIDLDEPCLVEVAVDAMPDPWPFLRRAPLRGPGASAD